MKPPASSATGGGASDGSAAAGGGSGPADDAAAGVSPDADAPADSLAGSFRTLDDFIARAKAGLATFTVAEQLQIQQETTATLVLDPAKTEPSGPAAPGEIKVEATARLAPKMKAVLTGSGFTIASGQADVQAVSLQEPTEWHWQIRPTESGEQRLTVTLSAIIKVDDEATERLIKSFDRTVMVKVSASEIALRFAAEHLEVLVGSLLVPLAGWAWTTRFGRRKSED